tara:strand:- start:213 stop:563 length:351 start_codon:yes stop_codon:yes gene_type:complete
MITINKIKEGSKIIPLSELTVTKINKKSIVAKDERGNKLIIRDRNFKHFGISTIAQNTTVTETKKTTISTRGRYPKWANSTPKKNFVMMERTQGKTATKASYDTYRAFLKSQRTTA